MPAPSANAAFDRYTEIGTLGEKVRVATKRIMTPLAVVLVAESLYLLFSDKPGATAFALIGLGTFLVLNVWCSGPIGLPLMPMMAVQALIIYGVPIAVGHDVILTYPPAYVLRAGEEVLIFNVAMALSWKMGMQLFNPSPPISYALEEFNKAGVEGWNRLGFGMIGCATGFEILQGLNLTDSAIAALPAGSNSILIALVAVVSASGFFLVSMAIGSGSSSAVAKFFFWGLLIVNGMMAASDFILYSVAANIITVAIGFFWSSGRVPWRYLTVSMLILSFLNTGKTTMRERHWQSDDGPTAPPTFSQLPLVYLEWIQTSYDAILENHEAGVPGTEEAKGSANKNQTLLDRVDNLQNLLFVIDAIDEGHVKPLYGATYSLIPPLLVPRILWPDKPRSHEGQVMLNVHFGRQDLNSTISTYIAWGLLPEAYGNFGPVGGSICIGVFLGLTFAWIENLTARKLVVSMEGFLSLSLLMSLMNSFEMVASVLVTSIFQSFVVVVVASVPFVRRTVTRRPETAED